MADSDIALRFGADISGLVSGMAEASNKVKGFGGSTDSTSKSLQFMQKIAGAAAATMAVAFVKSSFDAINAQSDLKAQLSTTSASIATMTRAADLAGISQGTFESASKKLSLQMASAADGSGKSAELFDRLGLSVADLSRMPLDERFAAINTAISENIPKTEQAAAAQQLFGKGAALAMSALSPETIARASEEIQVLGLNISEIDAAAVGGAEDSIKLLGVAAQGVGQQLSSQLAPYIQAVGDMFFDSAKEGGGFGNEIQLAVEIAIKTVGFLADAMAGFMRVVSAVGNSIMVYLRNPINLATVAVEMLIRGIDAIPGIDLSESVQALEKFNAESLAITQDYKDGLVAALETPLPSEQFQVYVDNAKKAATQAAAEQKKIMSESGGGSPDTSEQDKEAKKQAETLAKKLQALADSYKSEEQLLADTLKNQNALIAEGVASGQLTRAQGREMELAAMQKFTDDSNALAEKRAEMSRKEAEEQAKAAEVINAKLQTVRDGFKTEAQLLNDSYAEKAAIIAEWEAAEDGRKAEADALRIQARQQYNDAIVALDQEAADKQRAIDEAKNQALMSSSANAISAIGNLLSTGSKKQFEISKKLGLSAAAISMYQGIAAGVALGFPLAIPAVAYAAATGLSAIQNIRSQSFGGGPSGSVAQSAPTLPTDTNVAGNAGSNNVQNITVRGINPGQFFSGQQILDIINAAQENGGILKAG